MAHSELDPTYGGMVAPGMAVQWQTRRSGKQKAKIGLGLAQGSSPRQARPDG